MTKLIRLQDRTYERLKKLGIFGETFNDIIERLMRGPLGSK